MTATLHQALERGKIDAERDWTPVADVMTAMGLLGVINGESVDADFIRQVIDSLVLPALKPRARKRKKT